MGITVDDRIKCGYTTGAQNFIYYDVCIPLNESVTFVLQTFIFTFIFFHKLLRLKPGNTGKIVTYKSIKGSKYDLLTLKAIILLNRSEDSSLLPLCVCQRELQASPISKCPWPLGLSIRSPHVMHSHFDVGVASSLKIEEYKPIHCISV